MNYSDTDIIELGGDIQVAITYKNLLAKIATYIYCTAARETTTCCWCVDMEEIEEYFALEPGWIDEEIADDIDSALYEYFGNFIAESYVVFERGDSEHECERYFDVDLFTNYCMGILQDDCSIEYSL